MADKSGKIRVGILTVSDSCFNKRAEDRSGSNLSKLIDQDHVINGSVVIKDIVPDDLEIIKSKLLEWCDMKKVDLILTTGGTGFSPRDVTPEATRAVLEKEAIGMTIAMIKQSLDVTDLAMLSRLVCGIRKKTLLVNLPGSKKGSEECFRFAMPGIPHAVDLLREHKGHVSSTHARLQSEGVKLGKDSELHQSVLTTCGQVILSKNLRAHKGRQLSGIQTRPSTMLKKKNDLASRLEVSEYCSLLPGSERISTVQAEVNSKVVNSEGNNLPSVPGDNQLSSNSVEFSNEDNLAFQNNSWNTVVDKNFMHEESSQDNISDHNCDDIENLTNIDGLYIENLSHSSRLQGVKNTRRKGRRGRPRVVKAKNKLKNIGISDKTSDSSFSVIKEAQNVPPILDVTSTDFSGHMNREIGVSLNTEYEQNADMTENESRSLCDMSDSGELQVVGEVIGNRENLFTPISQGSASRDGFDMSNLPMDLQDDEFGRGDMDNCMSVDFTVPHKQSIGPATCPQKQVDFTMPHKQSYRPATCPEKQVDLTTPHKQSNGPAPATSPQRQGDRTEDYSQVYDFNLEASKTSPFSSVADVRKKKRSRRKKDIKGRYIHPKLHSVSCVGDIYYIEVGTALRDFFKTHDKVQGIHLNKGKRDIKKKLINLKRQKDAVDKLSWSRSKYTLDRNRLDDYFEMTEEGRKKKELIDGKKARDEYVVNWYMWCPGHGNCKRKCGAIGTCKEGCSGMTHKQDRHNCSVMINLKLFLSDLTKWRVHITGSHVPPDSGISWQPPAPMKERLGEDIRDELLINSTGSEAITSADLQGILLNKNLISSSSLNKKTKKKIYCFVSNVKKKESQNAGKQLKHVSLQTVTGGNMPSASSVTPGSLALTGNRKIVCQVLRPASGSVVYTNSDNLQTKTSVMIQNLPSSPQVSLSQLLPGSNFVTLTNTDVANVQIMSRNTTTLSEEVNLITNSADDGNVFEANGATRSTDVEQTNQPFLPFQTTSTCLLENGSFV